MFFGAPLREASHRHAPQRFATQRNVFSFGDWVTTATGRYVTQRYVTHRLAT